MRSVEPRPLAVHVVAGGPALTGVTSHVLGLAPQLMQQGIEVELTFLGPGVGAELAAARGVPVTVVPKRGRGDLFTIPRLARLFRRRRPALVHTHTLSTNFYGRTAARLAGVHCQVTTVHGLMGALVRYDATGALGNRLLLRWNRRLSRSADRVIAVSEEVRSWLLGWGPAASRVEVIRCGIDLDWRGDLAADRRAARTAWDLNDAHWVIGTIGRADPVKGQEILLAAAAPLLREDPTARLVIIGDGPERPRLLTQAREQGAAARVLLPGAAPDARRLTAGFDVFALSSHLEGIPLAMLEAMAAARPVVATDVGGVHEVVTHEVSGLLVPPGSPEALRTALLRLRGTPALAARLAAAGQRVVEDRYDVTVTSAQVAALYRDVLAAKRPGEAHGQRCTR
jgi:glycosyltransferase involved in cell wall biosynthesis